MTQQGQKRKTRDGKGPSVRRQVIPQNLFWFGVGFHDKVLGATGENVPGGGTQSLFTPAKTNLLVPVVLHH